MRLMSAGVSPLNPPSRDSIADLLEVLDLRSSVKPGSVTKECPATTRPTSVSSPGGVRRPQPTDAAWPGLRWPGCSPSRWSPRRAPSTPSTACPPDPLVARAYFVRGGDDSHPIKFLVEKVRDGRSFSTRRVQAVQYGRTILSMGFWPIGAG
ncbi:MAG: thioesterase family protein [Actinomycetales bacterium]|nr:thioesterase family protein [Actinomycetales bacterium]